MGKLREGNHILMKQSERRQSNIGIFLMRLCFICALYSVLCFLSGEALSSQGITTSPDFDKDALLDKVKETSLMNDIRWTENKGQLSINREQITENGKQNKNFYNSIRYYAKTPWGCFLIKDDNAVILNFIKPVKYTKDNVIVLVEQPDWEETARSELGLSGKKIAKLKEEGFIKANGKEIWLETTYRETRNQLPESRKEHGSLLEEFSASYRSYNLEVSVNGKKAVAIKPEGIREEKQSFFKGRDSSKWVSGLTTYNEMWAYFEEGVVFRFYAKEGKKIDPERFQGTSGVEKEVIIPEGIDLDDVYLTYTSDDDFELSVENDKLLINFDGYEFSEQVPFAYVIDNDSNTEKVEARYVVRNQIPDASNQKEKNRSVPFSFSTYNLSPITYHLSPANDEHGSFSKVCQIKSEWNGDGTFVFDPLIVSTYLGGTEYEWRSVNLALDSSSNVYITGYTYSTDFPTTSGAYDETKSSNDYWCISKLNSNLSSLLASTFFAGNNMEIRGLALDTSSNVYVGGYSSGTTFPTTEGAYDETNNGAEDFAIAKLNSNLTDLLAATVLGGSDEEKWPYCFELDSAGNLWVLGNTKSSDFPTTEGAYDETLDGTRDFYISKLSSDLSSLLASTYLGGSGEDGYYAYTCGLILDDSDNVYVTGYTYSTDFPTTGGAYDETGPKPLIIAKLPSDLATLSAATYFGATSAPVQQQVCGISLDSTGNVYVIGACVGGSPLDFPTTSGAYDETGDTSGFYGGNFISKLNSNLSGLLASTYLGYWPLSYIMIKDIELDSSDNVYVTGKVYDSTVFPITSGAYDETHNGTYTYFVSKLNSDLTNLLVSTYLGYDRMMANNYFDTAIALDSFNNVYVAGITQATDFPTTTGAYDETGDGIEFRSDMFISKLSPDLSCMEYNIGGSGDGDSMGEMTQDKVVGYSTKTQVGFTTSPSDSTASAAFPTQPVVAVQDTYGNTVLDATDEVTLTISNNPNSGTLGGDVDINASNGVATFSGLDIDEPAVGYTLQAASGELTVDISSAFDIGGPPWVSAISGNDLQDGTKKVQITYTACDVESDSCNITTSPAHAQYSQDDSTYYNATLSGTTTGITATPSGTQHSDLYWEAGTDLDNTVDATVYFRIKLNDGSNTTPTYETSASFSLDTTFTNERPVVSTVSGSQLTDGTEDVLISYTAADADSNACNLTTSGTQAQYSQDNSTWYDATLSGTTTGITAASSGTAHADLYWEAGTDLNNTEDSTVYFRIKLHDGYIYQSDYATTLAFVLDTKAPVISSATGFSPSPKGGDTSITLASTWTDGNYTSATSSFDYALDGESYAGATAGTAGTLSPTANINVGTTLDGHSYFGKIKSSLTDNYGNASSESEDTADVGAKPYTPPIPTLLNPTSTTVDVSVVKNASEATGLDYAIYVTPAVSGNNYVQSNGSIGASAVWQTIETWSTTTVSGLAENTTYTFKTKSRNYHVNTIESDFSNPRTVTTLSRHTLNVKYKYVSATQVEFLIWIEEGGQTVTSGLNGTATVNLYDADGSAITVTGNTDGTADAQGVYVVTPVRTAGEFLGNTTYYANIILPYNNKTYTKTEYFTIDESGNISAILADTGTTLPAALGTVGGKVDTLDIVADDILLDTGTTLAETLSPMGGKVDTLKAIADDILLDTGTTLSDTVGAVEGKVDTMDMVVDAILIDTGTTLSGDITTAKTDVMAELDKGPKSKILNRPTTAALGETLTIRYKTNSGLDPTIDVYDAGNTRRVNSATMTEIGTTGVYEYDLTLNAGWGTGDFTIICSEANTSSVDSMILEVSTSSSLSDLSTIESKINTLDTNIDTLVTNIASVKSTVEDTNSDLTTVQSNINSIITKWGSYSASDLESDSGNLGTYIGTPDDASGTDTVFGRLAQVYDSTGTVSSASTYAQNAYDEIQTLRNEVNLNGKTDTAYEMLVNLRDTLSELQTSISVIPAETSGARAEEIYNSINSSISGLKTMMADKVQMGAIIEKEVIEEAGGVTELTNQLNQLRTLLEIAKTLVEEEVEEPVVKSWFEVK